MKQTKSTTTYLYWVRSTKKRLGYCRNIDLAREIEITPGSCSTWIKSLIKKWMIEEDVNKFLSLTKAAEKELKRLDKNKEIFNDFIASETMIPADDADRLTNGFIHLVPQELIDAIYL